MQGYYWYLFAWMEFLPFGRGISYQGGRISHQSGWISRSDSRRAGSVKCQARSGHAISSTCRYDMAENGRVNTISLKLCVLSTISGQHLQSGAPSHLRSQSVPSVTRLTRLSGRFMRNKRPPRLAPQTPQEDGREGEGIEELFQPGRWLQARLPVLVLVLVCAI